MPFIETSDRLSTKELAKQQQQQRRREEERP